MEAVLGCSEGPQFGRGTGRLGVSSPPVCGLRFLDPALLAHVHGRTELAAWEIPPSCQRTFGRVELRKLMTGECLWLPPAKAWRQYLLR